MPTFNDRKDVYAHAWHDLVIDHDKAGAFDAAAHKIIAGRPHYEIITSKTGVPWPVIGLAHLRESDCNFGCHLHNGDSLKAKTIHVPAGRPPGPPPFSFEASAVDALHVDGLDKYTWDSVERIAFALETFNGFGYFKHGLPSAYLWAGTNQYRGGKYVADNKFDPHAMDHQLGTMGVLKRIGEIVPDALPSTIVPPAAVATSYKAEVADEAPQPSEEPGEGLSHPEIHDLMKSDSWSYWATHMNKKAIVSGAAAAIAFLQDHAVEIAAAGVVTVLVFEAIQYAMRSERIATS